jgi:hypothetical protein
MGSERRAREADRRRGKRPVGRFGANRGWRVRSIDQAADADKVWMRERGLDVIAEQYRRQEVALLQVTPCGQVSPAARYPARHGIPQRHGIPHGMVSHTAWYPARHGIPHGMVSRSGMVSRTAWYPLRIGIPPLHGPAPA